MPHSLTLEKAWISSPIYYTEMYSGVVAVFAIKELYVGGMPHSPSATPYLRYYMFVKDKSIVKLFLTPHHNKLMPRSVHIVVHFIILNHVHMPMIDTHLCWLNDAVIFIESIARKNYHNKSYLSTGVH